MMRRGCETLAREQREAALPLLSMSPPTPCPARAPERPDDEARTASSCGLAQRLKDQRLNRTQRRLIVPSPQKKQERVYLRARKSIGSGASKPPSRLGIDAAASLARRHSLVGLILSRDLEGRRRSFQMPERCCF